MPALSQLLMKAHDLKPRSMATNTLTSRFPERPHQPRTLCFPKRSFGKTRVVQVAFKPTWFDRWNRLHYDESSDAAFCHVCAKAEEEGKLKTRRLYTEDFVNGKMRPRDFVITE